MRTLSMHVMPLGLPGMVWHAGDQFAGFALGQMREAGTCRIRSGRAGKSGQECSDACVSADAGRVSDGRGMARNGTGPCWARRGRRATQGFAVPLLRPRRVAGAAAAGAGFESVNGSPAGKNR